MTPPVSLFANSAIWGFCHQPYGMVGLVLHIVSPGFVHPRVLPALEVH